jgi:hypothetical protein
VKDLCDENLIIFKADKETKSGYNEDIQVIVDHGG